MEKSNCNRNHPNNFHYFNETQSSGSNPPPIIERTTSLSLDITIPSSPPPGIMLLEDFGLNTTSLDLIKTTHFRQSNTSLTLCTTQTKPVSNVSMSKSSNTISFLPRRLTTAEIDRASTLNIPSADLENNSTEHSWPMIDEKNDAVKIIFHYHNDDYWYHNRVNVMSYNSKLSYNIRRPIINPQMIEKYKAKPINFHSRRTKIHIHPPY